MKSKLAEVDLTNKYAVLREDILLPEYRAIKYRIVLCTGGFGCTPHTLGRAVFTTALYDGEESRWNRSDFERLATPEEVEQVKMEATKSEKEEG